MTARLLGPARRHAAVLALALGALAGCGRESAQAQLEVANEIRALRLTLQAEAAPPAAAPAAMQRADIAAALSPLRDALESLGATQRELAARQATLTQELGRWTQLVIASSNEQRVGEARDLAARLQQLEQSMAAQDVRHREVEELLRGALDHTADQLENFLQRLRDKQAPAASPARSQPGPPDAEPARGAAGDPAPASPPPTHGGGDDGERRAAIEWLWVALLPVTLVSGAIVVRQLWHPRAAARTAQPAHAANRMPVAAAHAPTDAGAAPASPAAGEGDPDARELWAAAALLGEAVGRLRQSGQREADSRDGPTELDELELDEVFVIDEDDLDERLEAEAAPAPASRLPEPPAGAPAAPPRAPATPPALVPAGSPPLVSVHVPTGSSDPAAARARLLDVLLGDPRVLIEPAPQAHSAPGGFRLAFGLLPGLPVAERTLLEQRLRDCVA